MRCYHCGWDVPDGLETCPNCGSNTGAGATVLLDNSMNPYNTNAQANRTADLTDLLEQPPYATRTANPVAPVIQFASNRKLWKMILFGLLTFGIYDLVIYCKLVTELNVAACRYDGKRTMPFMSMSFVAGITLGIYGFVWYHKISARISDELNRRGYDYKFSAASFWLWGVLGSLILVGPLVYMHKLLTAMNIINQDFNVNG